MIEAVFVNGDTAASLSTQPALATAAVKTRTLVAEGDFKPLSVLRVKTLPGWEDQRFSFLRVHRSSQELPW
jgi:hypothetical protein